MSTRPRRVRAGSASAVPSSSNRDSSKVTTRRTTASAALPPPQVPPDDIIKIRTIDDPSILSRYSQLSQSTDGSGFVYFILPEGTTEATCSPNLSSAFLMCKDCNLNCKWMTEKDCLKHKPQAENAFVLAPFEGPAFNYLEEKRKTTSIEIFGPQFLQFALQSNEKSAIYNKKLSPYQMSMRNMMITLTGFSDSEKRRLSVMIERMYGCVSSSFTMAVTHVVADNVLSNKCRVAYDKKVPVMTANWVDAVWKDGEDSYMIHATDPAYVKYTCPIFHKLVICVSQVTNNMKSALRNAIEANGGKYSADLKKNETSVLVVPKADGDKFRYAQSWKLPCVLPDWVESSKSAGHVLDVKKFKVNVRISTPTNSMVVAPEEILLDNNHSIISEIPRNAERNNNLDFTQDVNREFLEILRDAASNGPYLDGCRIYVSGSKISEEIRKAINSSGATRLNKLAENVTHVLVTDTKIPNKDSVILNELDPRPHVVTVQWLIESAKKGNPADEEGFDYNPSTNELSINTVQSSVNETMSRKTSLFCFPKPNVTSTPPNSFSINTVQASVNETMNGKTSFCFSKPNDASTPANGFSKPNAASTPVAGSSKAFVPRKDNRFKLSFDVNRKSFIEFCKRYEDNSPTKEEIAKFNEDIKTASFYEWEKQYEAELAANGSPLEKSFVIPGLSKEDSDALKMRLEQQCVRSPEYPALPMTIPNRTPNRVMMDRTWKMLMEKFPAPPLSRFMDKSLPATSDDHEYNDDVDIPMDIQRISRDNDSSDSPSPIKSSAIANISISSSKSSLKRSSDSSLDDEDDSNKKNKRVRLSSESEADDVAPEVMDLNENVSVVDDGVNESKNAEVNEEAAVEDEDKTVSEDEITNDQEDNISSNQDQTEADNISSNQDQTEADNISSDQDHTEADMWTVPENPSFLLSGLTDAEKEEANEVISSLGGRVIETSSYDPAAFGIIANTLARSEKVLGCIAAGKCLLNMQYIYACKKAQEFISLENFLWKKADAGSKIEQEMAFAAETWFKRIAKNPNDRALSGMQFFLSEANAVKRAAYCRLINAGGGEVTSCAEEADMILADAKAKNVPQIQGIPVHLPLQLNTLILYDRF